MCQNRPEMVVESLSMLKQAQPDVDEEQEVNGLSKS